MNPALHFEDFTIGQRFALGPVMVTGSAIKEFAQEFDPQPFHLDDVAAERSVLQGLSASGFHTGALLLRMICDSFLSRSSVLGSSNMDSLKWLRPVHAGDQLTGVFEVTGLRQSRSRLAMGIMTFRAVVGTQNNLPAAELVGSFFFGKRTP